MSGDQVKLHRVFRKDDRIVARKIADEMLLVPIRGQLADMQRIFSLTAVAEYIWERLDGINTLYDIRQALVADFEVQQEQAEADILEFIDELQKADLIYGIKE